MAIISVEVSYSMDTKEMNTKILPKPRTTANASNETDRADHYWNLADHEHSVALAAVEALKKHNCPKQLSAGDCIDCVFCPECDVLADIKASGWQK